MVQREALITVEGRRDTELKVNPLVLAIPSSTSRREWNQSGNRNALSPSCRKRISTKDCRNCTKIVERGHISRLHIKVGPDYQSSPITLSQPPDLEWRLAI